MAILLDTGIVYAYYDRRDDWHKPSRRLMHNEAGSLIVPAPVIPEVDHLLGKRLGVEARLELYQALSQGFYFVESLPDKGYGRIVQLNRRYGSLGLGFVDASIVAIAESLNLRRVATTDRRDFAPLAEELELELLP